MSRSISDPEQLLAYHLRVAGLPEPEREFRFDKVRRWRFDFAYEKPHMIGIEVEGGTWRNGRHTRGAGYEKDCEKYNAAVLLGWRVFRFTSGMVKSGEAIRVIEEAMK